MSQLATKRAKVAAPTAPLPEALVQRFLALPRDRPFVSAEARELGLRYVDLRVLVQHGLLVHPMRGVYASSALTDCLELRIAVLRLMVPTDCVVTDRSAGWLWGARM